jgi:hypothetical protein
MEYRSVSNSQIGQFHWISGKHLFWALTPIQYQSLTLFECCPLNLRSLSKEGSQGVQVKGCFPRFEGVGSK